MRISILGGLEVCSTAGEPVRLATRKTALLLAALVLAGDKGLRREALCDAFWADRADAQARGSLRHALATLRHVVAESLGSGIRLDGDLEIVSLAAEPHAVDTRLFERLVAATTPAECAAAAELYRGDLLAGIALPGALDQWFAPYRRAYRQKALQLVERLSLVGDADLPGVAHHCQDLAERLLAADPAAEEAHRALIRLHRRQGHMTAAHRQFEHCKEALQRELGVGPEAETRALLEVPGTPGAGDAGVQGPATPSVPAARDRDRPAIIVMPFDNLSGDADGYFVDGVVEEITSALSRVREFFVIARQSAFTYKGRFVDVREVGRELGVSYIVEGTVRRGGDRLRISVQLVDAETRTQLWSDRYEGATTDIFAFQDRIAAQVAGAINPAVRNAEIDSTRRKKPESLRAYDLILQAYPKIWSQSAADNQRAIALLGTAIATEEAYGRAHALLAWCHAQDVVYMWSSDPEQSRQRARAAIDTAATLIGDDPTAMAALGAAINLALDDLDRASAFIESALALDPNNAWAWTRYGWLALYRDEPDRAIERFERALALSPLDPLEFNLRFGIAAAVGLKSDYATAARLTREMLNKNPRVTWAYRQLASFLALAGDLPAAGEAMAKMRAAHPTVSIATMKASHPFRNVPRVFDLFLKGWRLAGMPES